jgi:predicted  nucleic acid-binding Zn-ribbon protein
MLEPLSIAAAAAALATSLLRCIDSLHTIQQRISTVDHSFHNLQTELTSLQKQVYTVESSLSKQFQRSEYQYLWTDFDHAVRECKRMIGEMERQLGRIAGIEGGMLGARKVKKALGIWWRGVGIEMILKEIRIYRRTMKMSLQFIAV